MDQESLPDGIVDRVCTGVCRFLPLEQEGGPARLLCVTGRTVKRCGNKPTSSLCESVSRAGHVLRRPLAEWWQEGKCSHKTLWRSLRSRRRCCRRSRSIGAGELQVEFGASRVVRSTWCVALPGRCTAEVVRSFWAAHVER